MLLELYKFVILMSIAKREKMNNFNYIPAIFFIYYSKFILLVLTFYHKTLYYQRYNKIKLIITSQINL